MKSILEDYPIIFIAIATTIILFGFTAINSFTSINDKNESYISAVEHNSDYNIYLDGEKKDNSTFKISSLDKDKYSFEVDYKNEEININTNKSSNTGKDPEHLKDNVPDLFWLSFGLYCVERFYMFFL